MSKRPVLNDQQFSLKMQGVSDIYAQMQQELFDNMIKRLIVRGSADLQENPYIWQMQHISLLLIVSTTLDNHDCHTYANCLIYARSAYRSLLDHFL